MLKFNYGSINSLYSEETKKVFTCTFISAFPGSKHLHGFQEPQCMSVNVNGNDMLYDHNDSDRWWWHSCHDNDDEDDDEDDVDKSI